MIANFALSRNIELRFSGGRTFDCHVVLTIIFSYFTCWVYPALYSLIACGTSRNQIFKVSCSSAVTRTGDEEKSKIK